MAWHCLPQKLAYLSPISPFSLVYSFSTNTFNSCGYKQGTFGKNKNQMPKSEYTSIQSVGANSLGSPLLAAFSNEYWQASEVHLEILLRSCSCGLALVAVATLWDCNHFEVVSCFSEYAGRKSFSDQCIPCFEILLMLIENKIPKFKNFNVLLRMKHYCLKQLRHIITQVFEHCKVQINIMTCIISYLSYLGRDLASYHSSDFLMSKVSLHV